MSRVTEAKLKPVSKEFLSVFRGLTHKHSPHQVFSDFCTMSALSISNAIMFNEEREKRYLETAKQYTRDELSKFCELLALTTDALEEGYQDFLGATYMELEISNARAGQFFTPYHLSKAIAVLNTDLELFQTKEFVTVSDPACGAACMIIAMCEHLMENKINYQQKLHATVVDVSQTCAYMAYIQLSLFHVPAIVVVGNSLSLEVRETLYTPAHVMGLWSFKLKRHQAEAPKGSAPVGQLQLKV